MNNIWAGVKSGSKWYRSLDGSYWKWSKLKLESWVAETNIVASMILIANAPSLRWSEAWLKMMAFIIYFYWKRTRPEVERGVAQMIASLIDSYWKLTKPELEWDMPAQNPCFSVRIPAGLPRIHVFNWNIIEFACWKPKRIDSMCQCNTVTGWCSYWKWTKSELENKVTENYMFALMILIGNEPNLSWSEEWLKILPLP